MDSRLRQQLLELHYDLLPEAEAEELRARLKLDVELAAAMVEVQRDVSMLARAARLEAPPLTWKVDESQITKALPQASRRGGDAKPITRTGVRNSYWSWGLGIAAAVMLVFSLGGYQVHRTQVARLDREYPRVVVAGPSELTPNVTNRFVVKASTVAGEPLALNLVSTLHDVERDTVVQLQRQETDRDGNLIVEFTPKENAANHYEFRLARVQGNLQSPLAKLPLSVAAPEFLSKVTTDRPSYRPGDEVFYRSLTLSRANLKPIGEATVRYRAEDLAGNTVASSELSGVTDRGVGNGAFALPPEAAFGEYRLVAESPEGRFPPAEQRFVVAPTADDALTAEIVFAQSDYAPGEQVQTQLLFNKADGAPAAQGWVEVEATDADRQLWKDRLQLDDFGRAEALFALPPDIQGQPTLTAVATLNDQQVFASAPVPVTVERLDARFYPEGGDLVAGVENRVYFRVVDQLNRPVEVTGSIVDNDQHAVGEAATKLAGRGMFRFIPQAGRAYRLRLPGIEDATLWPSLPAVRADQALALQVAHPVIAKGDELGVTVNDRRGNTPIVVTVDCRDRQVAQSAAVTGAGANALEVPLGADASGVLRVTVYDCSQDAPRPVAERLVYRHGANRLGVALRGLKQGKYLPEEAVEIEAQLWDADDNPATDTVLGMSVFDDSLVASRESSQTNVATFFDLASQLDRPEELEDMNLRLDASPDAAVAIDLLLGTQGWRRFADPPSAMVAQQQFAQVAPTPVATASNLLLWDNLAEAQPRYEARVQQLRSDQAQRLAMLMICGGVGLAFALVLAALWRLVASVELALPSLAAAAGCVVLGVLLARSADRGGAAVTTVAFANSAPIVEVALRAPRPTELHFGETRGGSSRAKGRGDDESDGAAVDAPVIDAAAPGERAVESPAPAAAQTLTPEAPASDFRDGDDNDLKYGKAVEGVPEADAPSPPRPTPEMEAVPPAPEPLAPAAEPPPAAMKQAADPTFVEDNQPAPAPAMDMGSQEASRAPIQVRTKSANAVEAFDSLELRSRSVNNRYSEVSADGEAKEIYSFAPEAVVLRQRAQTPPSRANLQRRASRTIEDQTKFNVPEQRVGETLEEASQSAQQVEEGLARDHFVVRQYAHEPAAAIDVTRLQAQPSLYWNPLAVTDAEGVARFQFYAGAGDATYRVRLDAHDANGRLGAAESTFEVGFPFQLAETFPAGMTAGDRYDAPVEVENSSNVEQSLEMNVLAGTPALQAAGEEKKLALKANENRRMYVPLHAGATAARGVVVGIEGNTLAANEWKFSERVEQRMDVTSGGYPVVQWQAGWLIGETDLAIEVPRNPQPGSLEVKLWLYPGLPADFEHAHAALGELPRNNWNTQLALAYVDRQSLGEQFAGARVVQSPDYGNSAYGGFGGGHGDAYGPAMPTDDSLKSYWSFQPELLNFRAEVLGQQSRAGGAAGRYSQGMQRSSGSYGMRGADISRGGGGAGAYGPAPRGGAQFGSYPGGATNAQQIAAPGFGVAGLAQTSPEVTATWELANQSAGAQGLGGVNLQAATEFARKLHEPTTTGVVANGLLASGDEAAGKELLDRLVTWQRADGRVESEPSDKAEAAQTAVSPSTSSPVANTAIAALAWFKLPEYHDAAKKSIDWLVTQRRGGGFGSADDTYLALRALEAHAANGYRVPTLGVAMLSRGDETLGRLTYDSSAGRLITFEGFESQLAPGENRLTLSTTAPEPIPYAIEVRYNADQPQNDAALPVTLLTSMSADRAELSQLVKLRVDVTNTSATPQDYIVAELGLPAGLEPNVEQLSKLQSDRRFDHFEAKARTLIPYWRSLAPNETRTVEFDLNAVAPGQFTSPASTVYRLTSPEQRNWSAPMKIEVDRPAQ